MNPIQKQDRLEVVIISTGFNGISIARNEGIVIFVDGGIAGDKVLVEVYKVKKQHCEARIIEIKSYSDKRVKPQCQHFGVCGGCKWQHLQYESQLSEKQQQVIDAIERVGGFKNILVEPILPSSELYFYRNKLEFSFGTSRWKTNEELLANPIDKKEFILGFHAPQRWDKLVHIEECHLQSKQSNEILSFVRNFANQNNLTAYDSKTREGYLRNLVIREGKFTNETLVNLVTSNSNPELMKTLTNELLKSFPNITTVLNNINSRQSQVAIGEVEIIYHGDGFIHEKIDEQIYQISANSFFQTNSFQTVKLYNIVRMYAEIKESDIVYDLYCGTGTIALSIAPFVKKVIGVELEKSSITNANKNPSQKIIVDDNSEPINIISGALTSYNPSVNNNQAKFDFPFSPPVKGYQSNEFSPTELHFGIDFASKRGSVVSAVREGKVIFSDYTERDGNVIILSHVNGFITVYKHNDVLLKKLNQKVLHGESIALLGNTGRTSSGPHLHFELWQNGVPLNPVEFMISSANIFTEKQ